MIILYIPLRPDQMATGILIQEMQGLTWLQIKAAGLYVQEVFIREGLLTMIKMKVIEEVMMAKFGWEDWHSV